MTLPQILRLRPPAWGSCWGITLALARRWQPYGPDERAAGHDLPVAPALLPDDFERFFTTHETAISSYLWRMLGDEQSACDLAQETFLRAWQHFAKIRGYERPEAWLFRVATNLALQHLRRHQHPAGHAISLARAAEPSASDPALRLVEQDTVRAALLGLAPRDRSLLILREVHGFSAHEVANMLSLSPDTTKVALWRARARFRALYLGEEAGS